MELLIGVSTCQGFDRLTCLRKGGSIVHYLEEFGQADKNVVGIKTQNVDPEGFSKGQVSP